MTTAAFLLVTAVTSLFARDFPSIWYGIGTFLGAFAGWIIAYHRLRWVERNLDEHIFCKGSLIPAKHENMPTSVVFPFDVTKKQEQKEQ